MTLSLTERQIAMLAQMGVRVWSPPARGMQAEAAAMPAPTTLEVEATASAGRSIWHGVESAVLFCGSSRLCGKGSGRWAPQWGSNPTWMVVRDMPVDSTLTRDEEDALLARMLKALGRSRDGEGELGAYVTSAMKFRPCEGKGPGELEIQECREHLRNEVRLLRPRLILGMGRLAARALVNTQLPLGALRGKTHAFEGASVVVTYSVAYLLRHPLEKAKAWADFCLAADVR